LKQIIVIVACENTLGDSDFYGVKVVCTEDQIRLGRHRQAARKLVEKSGVRTVMCIDEDDPGFLWISVLKIRQIVNDCSCHDITQKGESFA
jgi:hypothetical protein